MDNSLKLFFNFIIISFLVFLITYLFKYNNTLNIPYDKLVAVGLTAGLIYLIIVYIYKELSLENYTSMGLKYFEPETKNYNA